jgi:hypothetical protein
MLCFLLDLQNYLQMDCLSGQYDRLRLDGLYHLYQYFLQLFRLVKLDEKKLQPFLQHRRRHLLVYRRNLRHL